MDDDRDADRPPPNAETSGIGRLVFFSDAVFAIAMTLLVLPLIGAGGGKGDMWQRLHERSGQLYAFAISFVIGLYWLGHHRLFRRIRAYNETLLLLNLFLLFGIAFLPYPTSETGRDPNGLGATVFYALSLSTVGLTTTACIWYAFVHRRLAETDAVTTRRFVLRSLIAPAIFLPSVAVAFASVTVARAMWWVAFLAGLISRRFVDRPPRRPARRGEAA